MEWYLSLRGFLAYQSSLLGWVRLPIIGGFIESLCVARKGYLDEGYPVSQDMIQSESYPECEPFGDVRLL